MFVPEFLYIQNVTPWEFTIIYVYIKEQGYNQQLVSQSGAYTRALKSEKSLSVTDA